MYTSKFNDITIRPTQPLNRYLSSVCCSSPTQNFFLQPDFKGYLSPHPTRAFQI